MLYIIVALAVATSSVPVAQMPRNPESVPALQQLHADENRAGALLDEIGKHALPMLECARKEIRSHSPAVVPNEGNAKAIQKLNDTMKNAGLRCGYATELENAASTVKSAFPKMSEDDIKVVASEILNSAMFWASISE